MAAVWFLASHAEQEHVSPHGRGSTSRNAVVSACMHSWAATFD